VGGVEAEFTFDGDSTWAISVTAGGITGTTEQTSALVGGKARLVVCCDHLSKSVFAYVEGGISTNPDIGSAWASGATFTAGRYAAVGHNNTTNGGTFDNFYIYELRVSAKKMCLECGCSCDGFVPGQGLTATVTEANDRAACFLDEDFAMNWKYGSGSSYWTGDLVSDTNSPTTTITYKLTCDASNYDATAWKAAGTIASGITTDGGVDDWNDPDNAKVDDDFNYTNADTKAGEPTKYLKCTNFGFSLPTDVTVVGVEVIIQRMAAVAGDVEDYGVYLFNDDSAPVGDNKKDPDAWPAWGFEESVTYGGSNDTWDWTLTQAIVESSTFGVIIAAVGKSATLRTAEIDYVSMKVYYRYRPGYNFQLQITNGACCAANTGGCSGILRANADSTCDPLQLEFGPFYLSATDLLCSACYDPGLDIDGNPLDGPMSGNYKITITDAV
jgi:hypothetical protein